MTLRTSLLLLTLAVLLPALLFMGTLTMLLVREERAAIRTGLSQTASALSEAADAKVGDALNSLSVLAANADLQPLDMAAFRREAVRATAAQKGWDHIMLVDATGRQLLNTADPYNPNLPNVSSLPFFAEVMATRQAYAGGPAFLDPISGQLRTAVALPIRTDGTVTYVLAAILNPVALRSLFERPSTDNGWAVAIVDADRRVIAQSEGAETLISEALTSGFATDIALGAAGQFQAGGGDTAPSMGAYQPSTVTGWTLVLAAPGGAFIASVSRSILMIVGGGLLFVALGVVLSTRMGNRIERATRSLALPARQLASGQTLLPRPESALHEIEQIGEEMDRAAGLLATRAQQQSALGALALKAVTAADRAEFFDDVLRAVTGALHVDFCDVLEYLPDGDEFLLSAGRGWRPGIVGIERFPNDVANLAGYTWANGDIIVYDDLNTETRVTQKSRLLSLGAVGGMVMPIQGPQQPFGILGIHSAHRRTFNPHEIEFARAIANVVSAYLSRTDAERQLADSERRLRHFVSSMNAVPYRYDVDAGRYTFVGPQSLRLLGFTPEEWGTVGWWQRQMHPEDRDIAEEQERYLTARGDDYVLEYRMITNEGRVVWIRDIVRVEIAENGHKMLYGMAIDITEARERERQLAEAQKLQAVGQLTGGVAHDFNNLLAIILGTCELMTEQAQGDPALLKTASQIATAAERGAALTQRLLAFSRRQALRPSVVDMNEMVREMQPMLERTLGETITIRTRLADNIGRTLADPNQLGSVLVNLALNARDAMPYGGEVLIETREVSFGQSDGLWERELPPGYYVMLAVSDTGIGMTPEVKERCFEPFFTTKSADKGSGLGLSTVYGFIKQSGGNITIYSEPGHGTTVRVYLPRVETGDIETAAETPPPAPGNSETVLVVEDDPGVRHVVAGMVESLGYQVLEAENGSDALALLEAGEFVDLVLTDVVMPGPVDGWKLAQSVWSRWPDTRVLLTTGYSDNVMVRHATLDDRTQVLSKPYRRSELSQKIRAVLDS